MRRLPAISLGLVGCAGLPHIEPALRQSEVQHRDLIRIETACDESRDLDDSLVSLWGYNKVGGAVLVSERHAVTALHLVDCPAIPVVHATLPDGRRIRMAVEKEWRDTDSARLVIFSDERFGLGVVPPGICSPTYNADLCTVRPDGESCGPRIAYHTFDAPTHPGDSGFPVYDAWAGCLVGITVRGNGIVTDYGESDGEWLEGT